MLCHMDAFEDIVQLSLYGKMCKKCSYKLFHVHQERLLVPVRHWIQLSMRKDNEPSTVPVREFPKLLYLCV